MLSEKFVIVGLLIICIFSLLFLFFLNKEPYGDKKELCSISIFEGYEKYTETRQISPEAYCGHWIEECKYDKNTYFKCVEYIKSRGESESKIEEIKEPKKQNVLIINEKNITYCFEDESQKAGNLKKSGDIICDKQIKISIPIYDKGNYSAIVSEKSYSNIYWSMPSAVEPGFPLENTIKERIEINYDKIRFENETITILPKGIKYKISGFYPEYRDNALIFGNDCRVYYANDSVVWFAKGGDVISLYGKSSDDDKPEYREVSYKGYKFLRDAQISRKFPNNSTAWYGSRINITLPNNTKIQRSWKIIDPGLISITSPLNKYYCKVGNELEAVMINPYPETILIYNISTLFALEDEKNYNCWKISFVPDKEERALDFFEVELYNEEILETDTKIEIGCIEIKFEKNF